ncbi:MAG: penicillin-binding protein activator, partial [Thalassolituus sp.]
PEKRLLIIRRWAMLPAALLAIAATGISGCSSTPVDNTASLAEIRPENSAQLQAVRQMIDAGEFGNARVQLQLLDVADLTPTGRAEWHLLTSEAFLGLGDTDTASHQLTAYEHYIDFTSDEQQYRAALLSARIMEAQEQYFEAARERDFVSAVISDELKQANYDQLWFDLMQIPSETLLRQAETAPDTRFGAWLTLAAVSRSHDLTIDEQLAGVKDWQLLNPGHPAADNLPGALAMTGPLARTGEAIRDGFMAAYYSSLQKGFPVPAITIIDQTGTESVDQGYAEAIQSGSQWLVGPLTKNDVQALEERTSLPLPTLALNYGSREGDAYNPLPAELFEFGLSAEDEAVQIADQAWKDGHRRALVMIPEG